MSDIGHGVEIELRYVEGELDGVYYTHPDPRHPDGRCNGYAHVQPAWPDGWTVESLEPLTISPSLLCRACGHHGFIRVGAWVPA